MQILCSACPAETLDRRKPLKTMQKVQNPHAQWQLDVLQTTIVRRWLRCCNIVMLWLHTSGPGVAGITDMFDSIQLIPASSGYDMHSAQKDKAHMPNIRRDTGVEYRDMLFFDDESPNVRKASLSSQLHAPGTCLVTMLRMLSDK